LIPQAYITEWANHVPWQTNEQVEQDLVICRALVEIFSDDFLAKSLAFRGGTSLHKLYLQPQPRYSEDIDLALDRNFLGFDKQVGEMTGSQVAKLRKLSVKSITEKYFPELQAAFIVAGFLEVALALKEIKNPDDDPITIEIYYPSVTETIGYI